MKKDKVKKGKESYWQIGSKSPEDLSDGDKKKFESKIEQLIREKSKKI